MQLPSRRVLRILSVIGINFAISAQWAVMAFAARHSPNYYATLGLAFVVAAVVAFLAHMISFKSLPHLSLRTTAASFALAILCYALPSLLTFHALNRLSSLFVGFAFATTPMWLWIYGGSNKSANFKHAALLLGILIALVVMFVGLPNTRWSVEQRQAGAVALLFAVFLFSTGNAVLHRVYWIHSASELAFWSMLATGIVFLAMSQVFIVERPQSVPTEYLVGTIAFGALVIALGGHIYRWATHDVRKLELSISAVTIPVGIIVWSVLLWNGEVAFNAPIVIGTIAFIGILVYASRGENATNWMAMHITNSLRKGDRVQCALTGYVKTATSQMSKVDIVDLSVGGLGFRCADVFKVADELTISIPMGTAWTQINLESKVMHYQKLSDGTFLGGVEFRRVSDALSQIIVEFLARVGNLPDAQQTQGLGKPKRKEVI